MRFIQKSVEPRSLCEYRAQSGAFYDGPHFSPVKADIRRQLLVEQGYLCCYCMNRIENNEKNTKIEHWHCQDRYCDEQLDYQNLLAACDGNQGCPSNKQHCDTRKGADDILYNPSNGSHRIEDRIHYLGNGSIESNETEFDTQLNKVLNLNWHRLIENRKEIIDTIRDAVSRKPGIRTGAELQMFIDKWLSKDIMGKMKPFCGVALYYLKKKLTKVVR